MVNLFFSSDYTDKLDETTHSVRNNSNNIQSVYSIIAFRRMVLQNNRQCLSTVNILAH